MDVSGLPADIQTKATQLRAKLSECIAEDDWKLLKHHKKDEVKIFSKHSLEYNCKMFKGVGIINASPESCYQHLKRKEKWDTSIKLLEVLDPIRIDTLPEAYIQRTAIHSCVMGLIAARDFVDLIINFNDEKAVGTMAQSNPTELCPPGSEYVRGTNHYCGMLATRIPNEPNKTLMIYVVHTDLAGNLPVYLVEKGIPPAMHAFYGSLKSQLKKAGQLLTPQSDKLINSDY